MNNPFNPPLAEGIRRFGFRKWYERELLSSHAHMLLALLSTIALLASFEGFQLSGRDGKLRTPCSSSSAPSSPSGRCAAMSTC